MFICRGRVSARLPSNFLVRDKKVTKEARLRRCPAELAARLQRYAQTGRRRNDFYVEPHDAYACGLAASALLNIQNHQSTQKGQRSIVRLSMAIGTQGNRISHGVLTANCKRYAMMYFKVRATVRLTQKRSCFAAALAMSTRLTQDFCHDIRISLKNPYFH